MCNYMYFHLMGIGVIVFKMSYMIKKIIVKN